METERRRDRYGARDTREIGERQSLVSPAPSRPGRRASSAGSPSCPCLLPLPPSPGRSRERYPSKTGSFLTLLLALQGAVRLVASSAACPPVRPSPTPTSPSAFPRFAGPARWQRDCAGRARQDRNAPSGPSAHCLQPGRARARSWGTGAGHAAGLLFMGSEAASTHFALESKREL